MIGKNGDDVLLPYSGESYYAQDWRIQRRFSSSTDGRALYRLPLHGSRTPEMLMQSSFSKDEFHLSPDDRWIAFNSLESGRWEVYVAAFPSFAEQRQVSSGGGCQPRWRKDGKELFYLDLQAD